MPSERLPRALGWLSLGLGAQQLLVPRLVNRIAGVDDSTRTRRVQRSMGLREVASGAAVLGGARPAALWGRVAGDGLDLALLGTARRGAAPASRRALALASVAAVTALDVTAAVRSHRSNDDDRRSPVHGRAATTIRKPPEEVYRRWRDVERLPMFMGHLRSVTALDDRRSHWVAEGPAGITVEWDAEIVQDSPGHLISWRSCDGADVRTAGSVEFRPAPGDQGTEVVVDLTYDPPGGPIGAAVAKLFGEEPNQQVRDDLRRFKQVVETGEVVRSEGSPEGITSHRMIGQRNAQPVEEGASA